MNTEDYGISPEIRKFADFLDPPSPPGVRCSPARSACNVRAHVPTSQPSGVDEVISGVMFQREIGRVDPSRAPRGHRRQAGASL